MPIFSVSPIQGSGLQPPPTATPKGQSAPWLPSALGPGLQVPAAWVKHREETLAVSSGPLGAGNLGSQILQQGLEKGRALGGHIHLYLQGEKLQEGQSGASKG